MVAQWFGCLAAISPPSRRVTEDWKYFSRKTLEVHPLSFPVGVDFLAKKYQDLYNSSHDPQFKLQILKCPVDYRQTF